jgi:hypothetical protein
MGEERKVYKVLVGKPEGKRPLGGSSRRWEDGIGMDLREIGWGSVEWIQLARDRDWWQAIVNTVMNLRVLAPWTPSLASLNVVVGYICLFMFFVQREEPRLSIMQTI